MAQQALSVRNAQVATEPERLAVIISALSELNRENAPVKVTTLLIDRLRRIHMGGEMAPVSTCAG